MAQTLNIRGVSMKLPNEKEITISGIFPLATWNLLKEGLGI